MKLATWNLALPVVEKRRREMRAHTDREQADVWVLTETHDSFMPGHPWSHSSTAGRDGLHRPEHRWVTIWSQYPLQPLETSDPDRAAAARILPTSGAPFIVYGTVLPWIGSPWREHPSAGGAAFGAALAVQASDWKRIRLAYPDDEFFVLGDLNQALVSPRYYGSRANRVALEKALDDAGLEALTAGAGDPIRRDSAPCAAIDHICARRDSKWRAAPAVRWPDVPVPEKWLTDHFGVSVAFAGPPPAPTAPSSP
ncbi:MAG: endonuclease/exonuclease/phosphatase family protein [Pseudomonadota bacterium]|nr:endonuclease/exonuclease/phosphatase family protein [Pseudomonadota bacterium]